MNARTRHYLNQARSEKRGFNPMRDEGKGFVMTPEWKASFRALIEKAVGGVEEKKP